MHEHSKRNTLLACLGLVALGIYILACTSFSPDDTKVLYPAFDPTSGALGLAVYDREARASGLVFVPVDYGGEATNPVAIASILRAEWLANGREIVVASLADKAGSKESTVNVALIPWSVHKPTRLFRVPEIDEAGYLFRQPLCVAGDRVFLRASSKAVVRLDLRTGALARHEFEDARGEMWFYPAPDGMGVFYCEQGGSGEQQAVFGRLNPRDFSRKPLMVITNRFDDQSVIAYDRGGRVLAILGSGAQTNELVVLRDGQVIFRRSLGTPGEERCFGNAIFAADGKALRATFCQGKGTNAVCYGLLEIPTSDAPPRELTLIKGAPNEDDAAVNYFQAAISHDGKTTAIASTYLACTGKEFAAADCALFFVDLSDPKWKVTKVPIPLPAKHPDFMH
jgi:hypothetical protein